MALTGVGDVTVDQTAYNLATDFAFRPQLHFDMVATVKPEAQAMNGKVVSFNLTSDLSVVTTPLDESTDITQVAIADSQKTVTLNEYGNGVKTTGFLRGTSYIVPYDAVVANVVGQNAGISQDTLARIPLEGGTNVLYPGTTAARNTITPAVTITAAVVRKAVASLQGADVTNFGGYYAGFIHPHVALDLRAETGAAAWRDPHTYSQPQEIWNGEIGEFEGVRWTSTSRCRILSDAGSSTTNTDVYQTYVLGQRALAKAWSLSDGNGPMAVVIPGPLTDALRRFVPLGWYWLGGYGRFREESLYRIESASSIGSN